jgi:hypothetical protein
LSSTNIDSESNIETATARCIFIRSSLGMTVVSC